jgi:hypothetical protein
VAINFVRFTPTGTVSIVVGCLLGDKSLWVWTSTARAGGTFEEPIKRLLLPGNRIIDFDLAANLDMAVSITEEPSLVLSLISSGEIYRAVRLDIAPSHVRMTRDGTVVITSATEGEQKTRIMVCSLDCRVLFSGYWGSELDLIQVVPVDWAEDMIVCHFVGDGIRLMRVFRLSAIGWWVCGEDVRSFCVVDGQTAIVVGNDFNLRSLVLRPYGSML